MTQQWHAVGRSSDIRELSLKDFQWIDGYLLVHLNCMKTCAHHYMSVIFSALYREINLFYSLASQLVADPFNKTSLLFKQINGTQTIEDKTVAYVNRPHKNSRLVMRKSFRRKLSLTLVGVTLRSSIVQGYVNFSHVAQCGR